MYSARRSATGPGRTAGSSSEPRYSEIEGILKWASQLPGLRLEEVALQLFNQRNHGYFEYLLADFDTASLPSASAKRTDPDVMQTNKAVSKALVNLRTVFQVLSEHPPHPNADAYSEHCHRLLVERWDGVSKWIMHILLGSSSADHPRSVVDVCVQTMYAIVRGDEDNLYKEDIISRESTVDIMCIALCQTDPQTGQYHFIATADTEACSIMELFNTVAARSNQGVQAMVLRFASLNAKARAALVDALVDRPQVHLWKSRAWSLGAVISRGYLTMGIVRLIDEDKTLWHDFDRRKWLHSHLVDVGKIGAKAQQIGVVSSEFWWYIGRCLGATVISTIGSAPKPSSYIHKLVADGLLTTAMMAMPFMDDTWTLLIDSLGSLLPYLYLSRVLVASNLRGEYMLLKEERVLPEGFACIYSEYSNAFSCSRYPYVHFSHHPCVNMCSNIGHSSLKSIKSEKDIAPYRTCGNCHTMTYCSTACQVEDWEKLHNRECRILKEMYIAQKKAGTWPSTQTRYDQLRILQSAANVNESIYSPSDIKKHELFAPPLDNSYPAAHSRLCAKPGSSISTYDFHVGRWRLRCNLRLSLRSYLRMMWNDPEYMCLEPRVQAYIDDVESNEDSIILAEGYCRLSTTRCMKVLARLRYDPKEIKSRQWKLVNGMFRMVGNLSFEELPATNVFGIRK